MAAGSIKVTLNGKSFEFSEKIPLLGALAHAKIELPSPCHHDHLPRTCHCGLCAVGLRQGENSPWKIELACMHAIEDGMEVDTEHPQAEKLRWVMINTYLLKHPLDCSLCDKVGNCFLHKFALHTNFRGFTRVTGKQYSQRNLRPLGKKIAIDDDKCIFCGRCLKFCTDILGEEILGKIKNERNLDEINTYPGKSCDSNYSLNLVDICPAGALVENCNYDHLAWNLYHTPSISPESSVGINTYILHDGKHVRRIIPRRNDAVNESWMTDSARNLVDILKPNNRITQVMRAGERADIRMAIAFAVNKILLNSSDTCILCSGETSLEDQFVLKTFMDIVPMSIYFLKRKGNGDGFLISDDPYPNCIGAQIMRLSNEANTHENLNALYGMIQAGTFKNIICLYEDLFADGIDSKILDGMSITYIGFGNNRTAKISDFTFPVATIFERTGTFVNKNHVLQKFFRAVPPPSKNIFECWEILSLLMNTYRFGESADYLTLEQIWKDLPHSIEIFSGVDFRNLPLEGILLNFVKK
ncbi:MAG: molybdopterin-dependent oxidoreductase [Puniceicoccales bacterium]|jgi:NADH-quinone oxidoreductase subunit G|nr:molybdopterin-dependent oxidoreductase [Puniceicoccales bacterium]